MNNIFNILITSPSIEVNNNVSGIANHTRLILENNDRVNFVHFRAGKFDSENRGIKWFFNQFDQIRRYIFVLKKNKHLNIVHINMPLNSLSILRDTLMVLIASSLFRKKIILHFRGGKYNLNEKIPLLHNYLLKISIKKANLLIALGENEKNFFMNSYKINREKINILPNAVKIPESIPEKNYNNKINLLFLGRISYKKGLSEIIHSLELLKEKFEFNFNIAGDGPDKKKFLKECDDKIRGMYKYLGILNEIGKEKIFSDSHIFIMPSYFEGLPNSLLEAMSWKLIPFVTNVGSIPEVITHGKNGFLFNVGDYKSIYQKLSETITNQNLLKKLADNAYRTIQLKYGLNEYISKLNKLYYLVYYNWKSYN